MNKIYSKKCISRTFCSKRIMKNYTTFFNLFITPPFMYQSSHKNSNSNNKHDSIDCGMKASPNNLESLLSSPAYFLDSFSRQVEGLLILLDPSLGIHSVSLVVDRLSFRPTSSPAQVNLFFFIQYQSIPITRVCSGARFLSRRVTRLFVGRPKFAFQLLIKRQVLVHV